MSHPMMGIADNQASVSAVRMDDLKKRVARFAYNAKDAALNTVMHMATPLRDVDHLDETVDKAPVISLQTVEEAGFKKAWVRAHEGEFVQNTLPRQRFVVPGRALTWSERKERTVKELLNVGVSLITIAAAAGAAWMVDTNTLNPTVMQTIARLTIGCTAIAAGVVGARALIRAPLALMENAVGYACKLSFDKNASRPRADWDEVKREIANGVVVTYRNTPLFARRKAQTALNPA